jgi:Protein kinase domain
MTPDTGLRKRAPGGMIGKYQIVGRIGSGGFGTVFEAWDPVIKRAVAIKVCDAGRDVQARFLQEAELAGRLHHPNITTIYECGMEGDTPFMVQEFLGGEDLSALIARRDAIGLGDKIRILVGVSVGLEYAHRAGVVHRDVKPANVRVLENGLIKIMDFGIAKALDSPSIVTGTGITVGSSAYMAPEQVCGDPIDARADIFSFGVLAFELLTYAKPFASENLFRLLEMIVKEEPEASLVRLAPSLPPEIVAVVERAMRKRPDERFSGMKQLRAALVAAYPDAGGADDWSATREPVPEAEAQRVRAIQRYGVLDTVAESVYGELADLASKVCACQFGLVALEGPGRLWPLASVGGLARTIPAETAFVSFAMLSHELLVIRDVSEDVRFQNDSLITQNPSLRFGACAPLWTPDGVAIGALCVFDREPRELSIEHRRALRVLAAQVMAQLELRRHRRQEAESSGERLLLEVAGLSDPKQGGPSHG